MSGRGGLDRGVWRGCKSPPFIALFSDVFFAGYLWLLWKWYQACRREQQRRLRTLVEQITDTIQEYQHDGIPVQRVIFFLNYFCLY
jgi:hypothetical protein